MTPEYRAWKKKYDREYRSKNKEREKKRVSAYGKTYRKKNSSKLKKYMKDYHAKNKGKYTQRQRYKNVERLYGLLPDQYDALVKKCHNKCQLCRKKFGKNGRYAHVDHCHVTGKVRGLLCAGCNLLEGRVAKIGLEKFVGYYREFGHV